MRLRDLLERVNLPYLIETLAGPDAVRGLRQDRGGVICDPRPTCQEHHPSFSVYRKERRWAWRRHGGDGAGGSAFDLLLHFGYSEVQAWDELRRLAGVTQYVCVSERVRCTPITSDPLRAVQIKLVNCAPLDARELARARSMVAPVELGDRAWSDLNARGLLGWAGLEAGKLRRDFDRSGDKVLARAGGLAFLLRGPDGQPWGLKVRNTGTPDDLRAAGLDRYVYRVARHGAPAWCSLNYGTGDSVLLVEGELNGAAASRALEAAGVRMDVQGLAGAGGAPFLNGLAGQRLYIYADLDEAGASCRERLGRLAHAAGVMDVRILSPLPSGDFCDLAGEQGVKALGRKLLELLDTSTIHHSVSPPGEKTAATMSPPHQTPGLDVVMRGDPALLALRKSQAKLRKFGGVL